MSLAPDASGLPCSGVVPAATLPQGHPAEPRADAELLPGPEHEAGTPGHSYERAPLPVGWQQCSTQGLWGRGVGRPGVGGLQLACAHTHSLSHTQSCSPRFQEPLSYVKLHSDTPNPKAKCQIYLQNHICKGLSHTQSLPHIPRFSLPVFPRESLSHRASPRLPHPHPHLTHDLEKVGNLVSLTLYQCPWDLLHTALPLPPQDAIVLAMKSLPSQTLINLAVFGTSVQPLFPESRLCSDVSVQESGGLVETFQPSAAQPVPSLSRTQ